MRALVTGGAGFIGSNLVDALVADGVEVHVLDDFSSGRQENLAGAEAAGVRVHAADIRDAGAVDRACREAGPDVVFHLAAQIDVRRSVEDPAFDAAVNVTGTINVLDAALRSGVRRLVFASTGGALYGEAEVIPTPESAAIRPLAPYGTSKAAAETYLALYERLHGLSTIAVRFANVYGPRQDPHGEAGVVAIFCAAAEEGRPATVFGDGGQTRDYLFVGDAVAALMAAGRASVTGALNIGTGRETSVLDLAAALGVDTTHAPARKGEVVRSCLDASAAARALDWRAVVPLRDGVQTTLAALAG